MTGNQAKASTKKVFGERKEPPVLIIAHGEKISHLTFRPWMAALGGAAFLALSASYLGATAYLVLRDDLMSAGIARHARNQQLYEDRISALRTEVDRITSRQMLDQQVMENKVAELMQRQQTLSARDGKLAPLLERASQLQPMPEIPTESAPDLEQHSQLIPDEALAGRDFPGIDPIITGPVPGKPPVGKPDRRAEAGSIGLRLSGGLSGESTLETSDKILATITQNLHRIESEQNGRVRVLADAAYEKADSILDTLNAAGLRIETPNNTAIAIGGPLIRYLSPVRWSTISICNCVTSIARLTGLIRYANGSVPCPLRTRRRTSRLRVCSVCVAIHFLERLHSIPVSTSALPTESP